MLRENILSAFFNTVPIPIFYKDLDGVYIDVNKSFLDTFGYEYDEIVGKTIFDITPLEIAQNYQAEDDKLYNNPNKTQIYDYKLKNKKTLQAYKVTFYKNIFLDGDGNIAGLIGAVLDNTEHEIVKSLLKENTKVLEHKAIHDDLTNLPNKYLLHELLKKSIHRAQRNKQKVAILYMDLNKFKEINDTLGHATGDKVLIEFSKRVKDTLRDSDTLSRIGGDEFIIIIDNFVDSSNLTTLTNKIIQNIKKDFFIKDTKIPIRCSIGISIYPDDGLEAEELKINADTAMYSAKSNKNSDFIFYSHSLVNQNNPHTL